MNPEIETIETKSTDIAASSHVPGAVNPSPASQRSRYTVVASVAIVLAAGFAFGIIPRLRAQTRREVASREVPHHTVNVTNATRLKSGVQLLLPGDVHAFEQTKIYARADGYLLKWNVDIGAKVQAGQVLAEIDTPELDQEL